MDKDPKSTKSVQDMRISYEVGKITDSEMQKDPYDQFKLWFDEACKSEKVVEPNAMMVCTASKDAFPSARPLLMKVSYWQILSYYKAFLST